ncbi:unnamed protein product [Rhodiola kirilowii]
MGPVRGSKKRKASDELDESVVGVEKGFAEWWDEFSKKIHGLPSPSKNLRTFESVFGISRRTFSYICSLVKDDLMSKSAYSFTNRKPMTLNDQVAIALKRLHSGDSLLSIGESFGLNRAIVLKTTWRFVESMEERALDHLRWPSNEQEISTVKTGFKKIQGLPNCCGAIDTTHITMMLSASEPAKNVWMDQEKNCSMVLQAVVDPDMRFRDIVTGFPGKMTDYSVLQQSGIFNLCGERKIINGKNIQLNETNEIREYLIGDSGYPLLPWLVTPYQGKDLSNSRLEFNKRHFATRMVAQRALARLKDMWKIIQGVMWRPDKHKLPSIILVCCLLHNIIIDLGDEVQDEMPLSCDHDPGYRQQICESVDKKGSSQRDKLRRYLVGTGSAQ